MTQFHIAFDESQKERGKLGVNYTMLRQILQAEGFGCWEFSSYPITRQSLQNYDILVVPCTDSSKFSPEEIADIAAWVKEDGGGLLLLSHAGGDRGRRTNMSELASQFGALFENDQVQDDVNNFGINNLPKITDFPTPHPIVEGIQNFCFRAGCSISLVGIAQPLATSDYRSQPENVTVLAASEQETGRVVFVGSYEMFRDDIPGGINSPTHAQLARNIFNWLVTDRRRELREGTAAVQPTAASRGASAGSTPASSSSPTSGAIDGKLVQINSVHDMFTEISNILRDIDFIRARVVNVYAVASLLDKAEEGEQAKATAPPAPAKSASKAKKTSAQTAVEPEAEPEAAVSQDDLIALIKGKTGKKTESKPAPKPSKAKPRPGEEEPEAEPEPESESGSVSDLMGELKVEQATRKSKAPVNEIKIKQPGLGKVEEEGEPEAPIEPAKVVYKLTSDDKRKPKEQLEDEIEKLESKLKSLENLKNFSEKKFRDNKIDETAYNKDLKKFQADIDATNAKIEAFKNLAGSK